MPTTPAQSGLPGVTGVRAGKQRAERLSTLLDRVVLRRQRVVLTRRGMAQAAMVPLEDLLLLETLEDRADVAAALAALAENGDNRTWEDVREVLGL